MDLLKLETLELPRLTLEHAGKIPSRTMDGPYADWQKIDDFVVYTIPASGTLAQGQPVCLDVTQLGPNASPQQAEFTVPATNANTLPFCMGVYQGAAIVNPSGSASLNVIIAVRVKGYGLVQAGALAAGVAVTVGGLLVVSSANTFATQVANAAQIRGFTVGTALATGAVTAKGATIIAVPGSGSTILVVNALIGTDWQ